MAKKPGLPSLPKAGITQGGVTPPSFPTARQRLLSQREEREQDKWYSGENPTTSETLARIYTISRESPERGKQLFDSFMQFSGDASSPLYSPYSKATNQAAAALQELGFDTSGGISKDWLTEHAGLKNAYRLGVSGTPLAPSSDSTAENDAAYWYYKALEAEDTTLRAENEWDALQEELRYWVGRTDRNYSDDEILAQVDWSAYPTLSRMDEEAAKGTPLSLNRGVGYTRDALRGVLWAARNDGGTGNAMYDGVCAVLGYGNQWQENQKLSAKLDPTSEDYNPYAVGSTMDKEALYFGVPSFGADWVEQNRGLLGGTDATAKSYYQSVHSAEETTAKAEAELEALQQEVARLLKYSSSPDAILRQIKVDYKTKYPTLAKMDASLESGKLLSMTRAVDYRWKDIVTGVEAHCASYNDATSGADYVKQMGETLNASTPEPVETPAPPVPSEPAEPEATTEPETRATPVPTPAPTSGEAAQAVSEAKDAAIEKAGLLIAQAGTNEEKIVFETAYNADFGTYVADITHMVNTGTLSAQDSYTGMLERANKLAAATYFDVLSAIVPYEEARAELDSAEAELNALLGDSPWLRIVGMLDVRQGSNLNLPGLLSTEQLQRDLAKAINGMRYEDVQALESKYRDLQGRVNLAKSDVESLQAAYDDAQPMLRSLQEVYNSASRFAASAGLEEGDTSILDLMDYAFQYGCEYAPTIWSATTTYDTYDEQLGEGAGAATARAALVSLPMEIARLDSVVAALNEKGVTLDDSFMENLERRKELLNRELMDARYYLLQTEEGFAEAAHKGREAWFSSPSATVKDSLLYQLTTPEQLGWQSADPSEAYFNAMTEVEQQTLFYLYETQGAKAAGEYFDHLTNSSYGRLTVRDSQRTAEDFASLAQESPIAGTALSILMSPMQAEGAVYSLAAQLTGREINPYHHSFTAANAVGTMRAVSKESIDAEFGAGTSAAKIANFFYDAVTAAGDSTLNASIFGPLGGKLGEFTGAGYMGLSAAAGAMQDVKLRGGTDEQALFMGGITLAAESLSEVVTISNIKKAFKLGAEGTRSFLKSLANEAGEEALGEALSELATSVSDAAIMKELSSYQANIDAFIAAGMSPEEAERQALWSAVGNILYAGALGAASSTVSTGASYGAGYAKRLVTGGKSTTAAVKTEDSEGAQNPVESTVSGTPSEEIPSQDVNFPTFQSSEEITDFLLNEPVVIDPSTLEEAQPHTDNGDLLGKQLTALAEAQNTLDEASQTATVAAVLAPVSEDAAAEEVASTAAQHMAAEYGADATVSALSDVLLTAAEVGVAAESVGTSVAVAALTSGRSHQVLSDIITNGATPENVADLATTVQAEMASSEMTAQVKAAVRENKIAHRIKAIVADGGLSGLDSYQAAANQAQENLAQAQDQLVQAQEQQAVAGQNAQSLTAQMLENPSNASMRGAVQQAVKDVEGAVIVTQQAEQSVAKAEAQLAEAEETLETNTQTALKKVREQAIQEIAVEDEQAAQEAEAQAQAEAEAAAKAHTEAVALHKPQKPYLATVKAFDGVKSHNIIGIHALSDNLDLIFMTDTGSLISGSLLDEASVDALMMADLDQTAQQYAYSTKHAVAILPQSVEAQMNETGEVVQIMGYGPTEGQTKPTYVLSNGDKVSSDAVTPLHSDSQDYLSLYFDSFKDKLQQAEKNQPGYVEPTAQATADNAQPELQLEAWQDPQYHGKVKPAKKLRTNTKNFAKWFSDPSGDLTNADGTPRVIYRGTASKLYMEHAAGKNGYSGIMNFYSPDIAIAKSYAHDQGHIISTYDIRNWETAAAAMKAEGYELRTEKKGGEWGYKAYGNTPSTQHYEGNFYRENEIDKFNTEYGGITKWGLYAGYLSLKKPLVIDAHGAHYTSTHGTAKDKNGNDYTATMTNREWGKWARANGYDAAIIRNSKDYMNQNGPSAVPGTVIMTFDSSSFKSVQNTGKLSKKKGADIRYNKEGTFALTGKPVSTQMKGVLQRLTEGYNVPLDEIMATPEVQWAEENMDHTDSMPEEAASMSFEEGQLIVSPERASEQLDIIDTLMGRGSAKVDSDGKTSYTGGINQNRRLDVVIGPPAAGKSSALVNPLSQQFGSRVLDCDDVKAEFREFRNGLNSGHLHYESRFLWKHMCRTAAQNGDNVVLPIVGHSEDSVNRDIKVFRDNGYDVHIHYVELDANKAIGRALSRFVNEGRYIDPDYLMYAVADDKISVNYEKFKTGGSINGYSKWSNDVPRGAVPVRLEAHAEAELDAVAGRRSEHGGTGAGESPAEGVPRGSRGSGTPGEAAGEVIQAKKGASSTSAPAGISTDSTGKPKYSPHRIAKDLTKTLGIGGDVGTRKMNNLPKAVLGYYEQRAKYIAVRSKQAGNYVTSMHEIGHAIADRLNLTGTNDMVAKLDPVFASSYSNAELPGEAFAEFMWRYMESDERARRFAGDTFVDTFEQRLRGAGLYRPVMKARKNLQMWINANANEKIGAVIVNQSDANKKGWKQRFRSVLSEMVDATAAMNDVDNAIRDANKGGMPLGESIREQTLLKNTAAQRAFNILQNGLTDSHWSIIGKSLAERFRDAGLTAKDADLLNRYALALHSLDREVQGKPVFDDHITPAAREAFIKDVEANHPEVVAAEKAWQEFRAEFLQAMMVDTGFMKQETLDLFNSMYPHYVPTMRVKEGQTHGGREGTYQVRRATGSTEDIINPMDSFVRMIDSVVTMVSANNAALAWDASYNKYEGMGLFGRLITADTVTHTVDTSDLNDAVRDLLEGNTDEDAMDQILDLIGKRQSQVKNTGTSTDPGTLQVQLPNGTRRLYKIFDPDMFKALASAQNGTFQFGTWAPLAWATRAMSALTTGSNPIFGARNFLRDFQSSVNYGSWASNYGSGMAKWMRAAYDVWTQKGEYKDYIALGGGGWTQIYAGKQKSADEYRAALYKGYNTSNAGRTVKYAGKKLWETVTLAKLNEVIEQTSRYAEYKYGKHDKTTAAGRQEAFLAGQDATVDFGRRGSSSDVATLKAVIPFFNASLQGVYRTGRMYTEKGERVRLPQRFAKTVANTALASALGAGLLLRFLDDDEREEFEWLSNDLKSQHIYIPNFAPDIFGQQPLLRIPLAQDPLAYAVHNAVTNAVWGGDDSVIDLMSTVDTILENLNPLGDPITQAWNDTQANRTWYGSKIVPTRMEGWDPTLQYSEETPELFIALGRMTGQSPLKLQYLAEQYTGFVGQMAIPALSYDETGEMGGFEAAINSARKKLTSDPLVSNDVISAFYDGSNLMDAVVAAVKNDRPLNMLRQGLSFDEGQLAYEEAYALTHKDGIVYEASKFISDTYNAIDALNARTDLTDEEKYELTSAQRREMIEYALEANEAVQAFREKYITGRSLTSYLFEGTYTRPKNAYEKLPAVFADAANQPYMKNAKATWEATGKDSALPHPNTSFTDGGVEYVISDDEWDQWCTWYAEAYQGHLAAYEIGWEVLSPSEQLDILSSAHTKAHNYCKKQYLAK